MKNGLKILAVALSLALIVGVVFGTPFTAWSNSENSKHAQEANKERLRRVRPVVCCRPCWRHYWWWFIHHSEPVEIEGTSVTIVRGMLVLNAEHGQIRILLPRLWIIGEEVIQRSELFNVGFLEAGETVTVKALRANLTSTETHGVYLLLGYEITSVTSTYAFAVLPFNIEIYE